MARFLHNLGLLAARRHWWFIGAWLVVLVVVGGLVASLGAQTTDDLNLPGTDSQKSSDLLAERFPPQQNGKNPIVFHVEEGKVTDSGARAAIKASRERILALPHVDSAPSPFSQAGAGQVSKGKTTAFIPVLLSIGNDELTEELAERVLDAGEPAERAGMKVEAAGQIGSALSKPETESSEVVGLAAAMVILALTFGSLVAMGMPIVSALVGLIVGLSLIGLLGHLVNVPSIGPTLATMIGLGVGIDYALFLLTRYLSFRSQGKGIDEAIGLSVATSGSAIVFAGSTVVLALLTLAIAGIPLVTSLGYAAAVAVVTAVLSSLILLPAVIAALGDRIGAIRLPKPLRPRPQSDDQHGMWAAWGRFVVRRPWRCIGGALLVLIVLAIPFGSLDLGQEDIGAAPKSTTERKAYDLISAGYGVGYNGPLLVAVDLGSPAKPSKQFKQQMSQAKQLQQTLTDEQQQGQSQGAELQSQASALEDRQAELESQGAALQSEADRLGLRWATIEGERAEVEKRRTLRAQLGEIAADARELASSEAKLAAEVAATQRELNAVRQRQAAIEAQLRRQPPAGRQARLERQLAKLNAREAELTSELSRLRERERKLETQAGKIADRAARLRREAVGLGEDARSLATAAEATARETAGVISARNSLEQQAAEAQVEAANLQAQKAELDALQQVAEVQQQQAEELQTELTKELTAAGGDERGTDQRLVKLQRGLEQTVGVDLVSPPQINGQGDAAIFTVIASTSPADPKTADLVETIRDYVIPQKTAGSDVKAHVGGQTASYVDLASAISSRLGLVIAAVIALGFFVLMIAFRSLLIPAQAAVANVLSAAAAFGIVTACFQFGWGLELVGLDTASGTDPIASFVPLIMFAVLFGLSMDYQVFLISQIEQHRKPGVSDDDAIAGGVASGARVISAAALIMIAVFASFILNGDPTVKQFGVGLSTGVALAGISVLVLAPAILVIAGKLSWWLPGRLQTLLPRVDIEGQRAESGD